MAILDLFSLKRSCRLLVDEEGEVSEKYKHFRAFLIHNQEALGIMAELEQIYYSGGPFSMDSVRTRCDALVQSTRKLVEALTGLAKGKYAELSDICQRIGDEIGPLFRPGPFPAQDLVIPIEALTPEMIESAGAKATNLARIRNDLGVPIPNGFVITGHAFERFLTENALTEPIDEKLARLSAISPEAVEVQTRGIKEMILKAQVPGAIREAILEAYEALEAKTTRGVRIAMRSSAVGEDTDVSFAGQYDTILNVTKKDILRAYKAVLASKYSPRVILYRLRHGFDDRDTPMCVAAVAMVDSRASGVIYTKDPSQPESPILTVHSIWGLGEYLVSGEATPDHFYVDRTANELVKKDIRSKDSRLVGLAGGGTRLERVPKAEKELPSIDDDTVMALARYGMMLEEYFKAPQDVEWAVDREGVFFILQSRPLVLPEFREEVDILSQEIPGHPVLLASGKGASPGIAVGKVFKVESQDWGHMPDDAILVARAASPDYARFMGKIRGIITDMGSVASHLSSVSREFGVPTIVDAGDATTSLSEGETITVVADRATVYQGVVPELADSTRPTDRFIFESPMHRRMRSVLDRISPLNLTDPDLPAFSPRGCKTIHDVIRFSHENAVKEMFDLSDDAKKGTTSMRLAANLPLTLYFVDLGDGLRRGLTNCDAITPDHIESIPMKALWSGMTHPGISWAGTMASERKSFLHLLSQSALSELGPSATPGGDSYALVSRDYVNLSAKFAYHYANIDAFCGEDPDQNHISLQFSGGGGTYYGRFFRINFLANVLERLGLTVSTTGDLLEASLKGFDLKSMEEILDQIGRLLASTGLLDMAISSEAEVNDMTEAFFRRDYDSLAKWNENQMSGFYAQTGNWKPVEDNGRSLYLQDGSKWKRGLSSGLHKFMGKMAGAKYQEFLDSIGAFFHFPLAIAKESVVSEGVVQVSVKPVGGSIDMAGGIAFGIRNTGNYFSLRINALEDNFILFEFVNDKRYERKAVFTEIEKDRWYHIKAEILGQNIRGYLNDELLIEYSAERPLKGFVGLWTKADSVTFFSNLVIPADTSNRKTLGKEA